MVVLDTDLLIAYLRKKDYGVEVIQKLKLENESLNTTVFNAAELYKGCYLMKNTAKGLMKAKTLLESLNEILKFNQEAIQVYAQISADLQKRGLMIGCFDELIASICIANKESFYTGNTKHFERMEEISVVNWREIQVE